MDIERKTLTMRAETNYTISRMQTDAASAVRVGLLAIATLVAGAAWAAQPELEPGNWKLTVTSTTNGKPEPVQNTEECLRDELKDLGAYFAPALEGVKAQCKKSRLPSKDPRKLDYRMQCTGSGFTVKAETAVTIEGPRLFTATMRMDTKTMKESAAVLARMEGRWAGACKPAEKAPAPR
jgi:hypothetical protein